MALPPYFREPESVSAVALPRRGFEPAIACVDRGVPRRDVAIPDARAAESS